MYYRKIKMLAIRLSKGGRRPQPKSRLELLNPLTMTKKIVFFAHFLKVLVKDVEERLDHLARSTGRTKSFYARQAILEHLDDLEDYYLAEKVKARIQSGEESTVPLDELMRRYGMES
jgi:RHH-type rel operon transcriptional repressor/antitoxin RelB